MDFSRKGTAKKQQQIKSASQRVASKLSVSLFRVFLVSLVLITVVGSFAGFGILKGLADSAPSIDQINVVPTRYTTKIYDKDGKLIESLIGAEANREYVKIDKIPEVVRYCFISIEDERFYEHNGIDLRGIFRAFYQGVLHRNFDEGASTITQQLIKNQVFNGGAEDNFIDRVIRKIQEQYLAIQLEDKESKNSILEYYLNTINLGAGTYGVQTASQRYFKKSVDKLNLSEAAVIAAIAQSPTNMNPITHADENAKRRANILENMKNQGHCTAKEYDEAIKDDVYSRIQSVNDEKDDNSYYSYFVDELIEQAITDLQEKKGYTYTQASNALYSSGLSIYTTQDSQVQSIVDDVYSNEAYFPPIEGASFYELTYALSIKKKNGTTIHYHTNDLIEYFHQDPSFNVKFKSKKEAQSRIDQFKSAKVEKDDTILGENTSLIIQPQSSMVIMDHSNGQVVALVGGRGEKLGNRTLNRATNTKRQPGSTFKILSTYLPALDSAGMTLATVVDDAPYKYPGTERYVNNWNGETFEGLTTLRRAIYRSMNIVTVKTLMQVTPQVGFDYLTKLGFTTLVDNRTGQNGKVYSDINPSLALGGITDGVTNLELTAAYAAVANDGVYIKPTFYTKILDHNGKVLLENKPVKRQVMKESTSYLLTSAMEDVVNKGTGTAVKFGKINMPIAGKTGTTSDYNDLWFSGYTPYYTATIWSGYDISLSQTEKNYHKKIWRDIMERIHIDKKLKTIPFTKPDSIVTAQICTKSGKLAAEGLCDKYVGGSTVKTEYFAKGTVPTEKCDIHVKVTICKDSKKVASDYCPKSSLEDVVYLIKEETSKTFDTPFILPTKKCNIHSEGGPVIPPINTNLNSEEDLNNNQSTNETPVTDPNSSTNNNNTTENNTSTNPTPTPITSGDANNYSDQ